MAFFECDCGARYSHPDLINACAANNHGNPRRVRWLLVTEANAGCVERGYHRVTPGDGPAVCVDCGERKP